VVNEGEPLTFAALVSDPEDLAGDLELRWESDLDGLLYEGPPDSSGLSQFLDSALSVGDHNLVVTVTDTAGLYATALGTFTVNGAPSAPTVSLSPTGPDTDDDLVVSIDTPSTDPDGDALSYSFAWLVGGVASSASTGATLPASATTTGETWTVEVSATDGMATSPLGTASVIILNADPAVSSVSVSPSTAAVGETLTCAATAADPDGGSPSLSYTWSSGATGATYTVTSADDPGDLVTCTVTATDSSGGTATGSASATVINSNPAVTASVSPSTAAVGDTLTCSASATDPDGGTPTLSYSWSSGATGATYTVSSGDDPGDIIICTATATDTDGGSTTATASATVLNTAPVLSMVSISPSIAYNDDLLTCTASASDADADSPTLSYAWTNTTSGTLTSARAASGDVLRCTVIATDPDGGTDTDSTTITIGNRTPVAAVSLSPTSPTRSSTLTCTATTTDADADSASLSFSWTVAGSTVAATSSGTSSTTLAGVFSTGQAVACTVTASDGKGGSDTAATSVTIGNTAPVVSGVTLSPSTAYTNDTLTASATTSDADGDTLSLSYDWYVEGVLVKSGTSRSLSGVAYFDRDEEVYAIVSASDGATTTSATSSTLTVSNTAPTAPVVGIDPSDPMEGEDLVCIVETESADADGDTITYSMAWTVDGAAYAAGGGWTGPTTTTWTDDTTDGLDNSDGEVWTCSATPDDGTTTGTTDTDTVTVESACGDGTVTLSQSGVDFVTVCGGSFTMGCTAAQVATGRCASDEAPAHVVNLSYNYYVSSNEVSQSQYQALMGVVPSSFSTCGSTCPVERVTWHMAANFANAMSTAAGLTECYLCTGSGTSTSCTNSGTAPFACNGYRLLTEAEWENAARCGTDFVYSGSDIASDVSWYTSVSGYKTHGGGLKASNSCGLFDMSGNVWEWTGDWYSSVAYTSYAVYDYTGPGTGSLRVLRGGGWSSSADSSRVSERESVDPLAYNDEIGFRVARTVY
jgi:formylglycine-generating enzyme required for sulfatase activity